MSTTDDGGKDKQQQQQKGNRQKVKHINLLPLYWAREWHRVKVIFALYFVKSREREREREIHIERGSTTAWCGRAVRRKWAVKETWLWGPATIAYKLRNDWLQYRIENELKNNVENPTLSCVWSKEFWKWIAKKG